MEERRVLVVHRQLVQVVQAGSLPLGGHPRAGDGVDGQGVVQLVVGQGVGLGVPGAGPGIEGAVKVRHFHRGVGLPVKGDKAQRLAQPAVGIVGPQGGPVMVGAVVDILILVGRQGVLQGDIDPPGLLHRRLDLADVALFLQQGRMGRHPLRVDGRSRRGHHHIHPAGIAPRQGPHRRDVPGQGALLAGDQAVGAVKHLAMIPQQHPAALGLLEQSRFHKALQADPGIPAGDLVFCILGVIVEEAVQSRRGQDLRGHGRALGQGGVFQLADGAVGGDAVQKEHPHKKEAEQDQHRVVDQPAFSFALALLHSCLPIFRFVPAGPGGRRGLVCADQKLKYRKGLLVLPTT